MSNSKYYNWTKCIEQFTTGISSKNKFIDSLVIKINYNYENVSLFSFEILKFNISFWYLRYLTSLFSATNISISGEILLDGATYKAYTLKLQLGCEMKIIFNFYN